MERYCVLNNTSAGLELVANIRLDMAAGNGVTAGPPKAPSAHGTAQLGFAADFANGV